MGKIPYGLFSPAGTGCQIIFIEREGTMDFISPDLKKTGATNIFVHVSTQSPASTVYRLKSASTIVSGSHELANSEEAFSDLLEEKMWKAYKEIEPRYSNANRKLAQ